MKLLFVHNRYRYPGGEDVVFSREAVLLRSAGHQVLEFVRQSRELSDAGVVKRLSTGLRAVWACDSARELRQVIREHRPDLVHFHNTFPLISPAAYYACRRSGIPVVQSLHNPRLICPAATLYRQGQACEDCLGRTIAWPGILHACYHDSRPQTAAVVGMTTWHRLVRTWRKQVDAYICFTEFFRQKFIAAGLPPDKIHVKPHFVERDPGATNKLGGYALFLGRLAPEKGVGTLLNAWRRLQGIPLIIAGHGQLGEEVREVQRSMPLLAVFPHLPEQECLELIKGARFLVWPSEGYYETFGLVAIEAFACGLPVIASRVGAMQELVSHRKTGLLFEAGSATDLAATVEWAWNHPREMQWMGRKGRAEYADKYTAEQNYGAIMQIYGAAIQRFSAQRARPSACVQAQGEGE